MTRQICFIGASGAGKSHTIKQLIKPDNPIREQLVVSDGFEHGTVRETGIVFPDLEVLDGDFGVDFDDEDVIASIKAMTHPDTLFVFVINGKGRRFSHAMIVGERRVIVFVNDHKERPLADGWQIYEFSPERSAMVKTVSETFTGLVAIVPFAVGCHKGDDLITAALAKLMASERQRYEATCAQREAINTKMRAKWEGVCAARKAFISLMDDAEMRSGRGWLAGLLLGGLGALLAMAALPIVAPLFAAAGLAGTAATSSGMATAPLVAGTVGGAAGLVVAGTGNTLAGAVQDSNMRQTINAHRAERIGVDFQISVEETAMLTKAEADLDTYFQQLRTAKPSSDNRRLFRELPICVSLEPLPAFVATTAINDCYFDGQFYHLLCVV
jgi:hypothetical protein